MSVGMDGYILSTIVRTLVRDSDTTLCTVLFSRRLLASNPRDIEWMVILPLFDNFKT